MNESNSDLASRIEHTLLHPTATRLDVERVCEEALTFGFFGVCVAPVHVAYAAQRLAESPVRVVSVIAFPLGATLVQAAVREAELVVAAGAHEIDYVAPLALAKQGYFSRVCDAVASVRAHSGSALLKVILETAYFSSEELCALAGACIDGGADFLKTSTGFAPAGARIEDVRLLDDVARGRARIKASGGIRTAHFARALLEAGASRLGTSSSVALVTGASARGDY
jgi:deoxyribose-phosphate aldolase